VTRHVAFLRAVNVGGRIVRMEELRKTFEAIPLGNVATFIASGNVLFDSKKSRESLERSIEHALKGTFGFDVATMVRSGAELAAVVEQVGRQGMRHGGGVTLYVGFLKRPPARANADAVAALSNEIDVLSVQGRELYWQCHKSFAESTVAGARLEKLLATAVTIRNFNTVQKLAARTSSG
jgi:uncharacterized protein (DUF1697 family)